MNLQQIADRITRLERGTPSMRPGIHRMSDAELDGLTAVVCQAEAREPIDPDRRQWAIEVLRREH